MSGTIAHRFADITATLEDMHAIAVDGQRRDNSPDMQRAIAANLRAGATALTASLRKIERRLGTGHD